MLIILYEAKRLLAYSNKTVKYQCLKQLYGNNLQYVNLVQEMEDMLSFQEVMIKGFVISAPGIIPHALVLMHYGTKIISARYM
jgi:hypothetical protein